MPGARSVGPGFSPLDDELGLLPGTLTPTLQAHLSRLGAQLSFTAAAREVSRLTGVRVSPATVRRRTEADGAALAAWEAAEAVRVLREAPPPPAGPPVLQVSVDGTMVGLQDGAWREVRTLAIGTVVPGRAPGTVACTHVSVFARLADAATFTDLAAGEIHRRGVETAGIVVGVVDGAPWCQTFLDVHCPQAVRILDFPHAAQRLTALAEAVWGPGATAQTWAATQRQALRDGSPEAVLAAIAALPLASAPVRALAQTLHDEVVGYVTPRLAQMRYAVFRAQGLPIGSGIVESANKTVVAARLKGAGMRWSEGAVTPMLALRGALGSGRWDEAWATVAQRRRWTARHVRARRAPREVPATSAASVVPPRAAPPAASSLAIPRSGPKTIINGRPTAAHPWNRSRPRPATASAKS